MNRHGRTRADRLQLGKTRTDGGSRRKYRQLARGRRTTVTRSPGISGLTDCTQTMRLGRATSSIRPSCFQRAMAQRGHGFPSRSVPALSQISQVSCIAHPRCHRGWRASIGGNPYSSVTLRSNYPYVVRKSRRVGLSAGISLEYEPKKVSFHHISRSASPNVRSNETQMFFWCSEIYQRDRA